ncbi:MAG: type II secretion system F family protein [Alphaproteobacteria bacterium]|nr:type II secretion system F family protein [Alphaproteobacteria bacterium]
MQLYLCKVLDKYGKVTHKKIFLEKETNLYEVFANSDMIFISKSQQKSSIRAPVQEFTLPFFKHFGQLIKNQLNIPESLQIIKNLFVDEEARLIIETIIQQIHLGMSLSQSLSKFERFFDKISLKAIEVSEKTAKLPEAIAKIVYHVSEKQALKSKIKTSMRYPLILCVFVAFTFVFWIFVLVPKFAELFCELNIQPPIITRIVINLSNFVIQYFWIIVLVCCVLFFIPRKYKFNGYHIAIFNTLKREIQVYNFFASMEIMLHEKVNLIDALECISDITPEIKMVISYIKSGVYLSEAIKKCNFLNECELSIIKTGEKSGELWAAFKSASDISKQNIENLSQRIVAVIQPFAISFLGLLLIIFIYALIVPLYSNLNMELQC